MPRKGSDGEIEKEAIVRDREGGDSEMIVR